MIKSAGQGKFTAIEKQYIGVDLYACGFGLGLYHVDEMDVNSGVYKPSIG